MKREAEKYWGNGVVLPRLLGIHTNGHAPSSSRRAGGNGWRGQSLGRCSSRGKHRFAAPGSRANIRPRMSDTQQIRHDPPHREQVGGRWSLFTIIMGNTMPPRDPNDDDDDEGQQRISGPRDPYIFALAVAVALIVGVLVVSIAWPDMLPWAQKARVVSR